MNMNTNTTTAAPALTTPPESTNPQQAVMSESLRPRWCVQRDDSTVVPLIAMDELPESVLLKGVPATLTVLEALKARMELITGDHRAHGIRYQLDRSLNTQTDANEEGDESGSDGSRTSEGSESSTQKGSSASDNKGDKPSKGKALV